jgi:HEAT repeat protein
MTHSLKNNMNTFESCGGVLFQIFLEARHKIGHSCEHLLNCLNPRPLISSWRTAIILSSQGTRTSGFNAADRRERIMALFGRPNIRKLKDRGDFAGLLKALNYEKDDRVRYAAVEALGDLREKSAVQPLLALLDDQALLRKEEILSALGKIGDTEALPPIIRRIKHRGILNSPHELDALESIGLPAAPALLSLLEERSTGAREAVIVLKHLEAIGGPEVTGGVLKLLTPRYSTLIPQLAEMLERTAGSDAIPALVSALKAGPAEEWASHLVSALKRLHWSPAGIEEEGALAVADRDWKRIERIGTPAVDFLLPLLQKARASDIIPALEVLGGTGGEQAIEQVAALLDDRRPDIVTAAARALGRMGSGAGVPPLIRLLGEAGSQELLSEAENALLRISGPAVEPLIAQLNSGDPEERRSAVRILGEIGDKHALPFLAQARDDPSLYPDIDTALQKLGWQPPE